MVPALLCTTSDILSLDPTRTALHVWCVLPWFVCVCMLLVCNYQHLHGSNYVVASTQPTSVLCSLEYGTYVFFAFWVFLMTVYALGFLPETKGVPIEEMGILWRRHWFWSKVIMTPEERAAFQKGDLAGAGVSTGSAIPENAGKLGHGHVHTHLPDGRPQPPPMAKDLGQF